MLVGLGVLAWKGLAITLPPCLDISHFLKTTLLSRKGTNAKLVRVFLTLDGCAQDSKIVR